MKENLSQDTTKTNDNESFSADAYTPLNFCEDSINTDACSESDKGIFDGQNKQNADVSETALNEASTNKCPRKGFFNTVKSYIKLFRIELIIIFAVLVIDLVTKFLIDKNMNQYEVIVIIKNFLNFRYVFNEKAAFGSAFGLDKFFGDKGVMVFFIIFSVITISLFIYLLYKFKNRGLFVRFGFSLVIGGALGNFYDRIAFGYVRDFVEIVFFGADIPYLGSTFAIFNMADSALVIGMFMLIFYFIFKYSTNEKADKEKK